MIEAYKGEKLKSIYRILSVVSEFPKQVIVMKNTGMCMTTHFGSQISNRLIWREHTEWFPYFIDEIQQAENGNILIERSILERGAEASERLNLIESNAIGIMDHHKEMLEALKPEHIEAIRGRRGPPQDILSYVHSIVYAFARDYGANLGPNNENLKKKELLFDFKFRMGFAVASWLLEWIRTGCQDNFRSAKVINDFVDTMLSAYGTYFNGIMSKDKKLNRIHGLNRLLLNTMGVNCPPPYSLSN